MTLINLSFFGRKYWFKRFDAWIKKAVPETVLQNFATKKSLKEILCPTHSNLLSRFPVYKWLSGRNEKKGSRENENEKWLHKYLHEYITDSNFFNSNNTFTDLTRNIIMQPTTDPGIADKISNIG